jgi:hypothetical protein
MYQCKNSSKCIPKLYINDDIRDCDYEDDEEQSTIDKLCLTDQTDTFFKCQTDNKCIHRNQVQNHVCNCKMDEDGMCDDEEPKLSKNKRRIIFPTTCDNFVDLSPIIIDGRNHTNETECEQWPCNKTYTRCDDAWNCCNGADEIHCDPSSSIQCPPNHHICISQNTTQLMCLSLKKVNDDIVDCLGGIDERLLCPIKNRSQA